MEFQQQPVKLPVVRKKAWHNKTKNGCLVCRARRIRCDQSRPECQKCIKHGSPCKFPLTTFNVTVLSPTPASNLDLAILPFGRRDFQFYICSGAPMLAQWHAPDFWLTTLPTASDVSFLLKCALLAMSSTTQLIMNTSSDSVQPVVERGDVYYGRACSMLRLGSTVNVEEALKTSFVLWCHDWLAGRQRQSFVHTNAAVKLFQSLVNRDKFGLSAHSRGSRESMVEIARTFFRDMHFPVDNEEFLRMLERRGRPHIDSVGEGLVIQRPIPLMNPFADLANPMYINSFFWLVIVADSQQAVHIIQQALDHCAYEIIHDALPRSRQRETFKNQIDLFQKFCEMHLRILQNLDEGKNDQLMSDMLDLIQANMQLQTEELDSSPCCQHDVSYPSLGQGPQCYLGVLGLIANRAQSSEIRGHALNQIMSHCTATFS